jgi:L-ascorbate metabolism protein UlaG (beta-lactamase superfamily)
VTSRRLTYLLEYALKFLAKTETFEGIIYTDLAHQYTEPLEVPVIMKASRHQFQLPAFLALAILTAVLVFATDHDPKKLVVERLPNGEVKATFAASKDHLYRIEASQDLKVWTPLSTVEGDASIEYLDTEATYVGERFYRAVVADEESLTGDHFVTTDGIVTVHPVDHASFIIEWNGLMIYNDPVGGTAPFREFPPADLILVGHQHGDHFNSATLSSVKKDETIIITPQAVFDQMSSSLKSSTTTLGNSDATDVLGLNVEAVPAYNDRHPRGRDNGYVLTIGGVRFYMSGDTGATDEMRALPNIDVAFVCMNLPFTMSVDEAASAVRDFKPKFMYPYHHRGSDIPKFKDLVGKDSGVAVRIREWY